ASSWTARSPASPKVRYSPGSRQTGLRAVTSNRLRGLAWAQPEPRPFGPFAGSSRIPMLPSTWTMRWSGYRDHLIGEGLGTKTIARYMRWVRDADEWLQKRGLSLDEATATQ